MLSTCRKAIGFHRQVKLPVRSELLCREKSSSIQDTSPIDDYLTAVLSHLFILPVVIPWDPFPPYKVPHYMLWLTNQLLNTPLGYTLLLNTPVIYNVLKCLWTENCFSLVFKFALKNTRFQSLRSLGLKLTITSLAFLPSKMVCESRGQNTRWYQLLTSLWCHNCFRNMADKKEKRQRGRYCVAGTPNQQSCIWNRWTCFLPYSLTCQQETVTA